MTALFDNYQAHAGRYDELVTADGGLRAHWADLAQVVAGFDARQLSERRFEMQRMLREHGVTYNIYGRDRRTPGGWALDLLPLVLTSVEWRDIEVGMAQRAELLRVILADIYGPQRLLSRGLLPARLVLGHPGFLLPCWQAEAVGEQALTLYAADLGRQPDGSLWVTADRTQAPSGMGYALEARTISSRVLPSLFRESHVHPVLPFVRALRRRLVTLAEDEPEAIGVLTPGAANETYSEHAYLARQLGLSLVEGEDLMVEQGKTWMLGATGPQAIRVLLRRMDDHFCEPLELNRHSLLGTPGLLQSVRNRSLCMVNPLGSGVVENPGLMPFLPQICKQVLGEELKLPSVTTLWCANSGVTQKVFQEPERWVLRNVRSQETVHQSLAELSQEARTALREQVEADPESYVVQPALAHSCAPVLTRQGVVTRSVEMRTFALAEGEEFRVMTGGLARTGRSADSWRVSGQLGGVSKDIWVLASEAQRDAQILPQFLRPRSSSASLRDPHVAERLLWMGRYLVRGEILARLLQVVIKRLIELAPQAPDVVAQQLCRALTWQTTLYPGFVGPMGESARQQPLTELQAIMCGEHPSALRGLGRQLRDDAFVLRHLLPAEGLAQLARLDEDLVQLADYDSLHRAAEQAALRLAAVHGGLLRSLPEDSVRHLLELGAAVENTQMTVRLLRSLIMDPALLDETGPALFDVLGIPPFVVGAEEQSTQEALLQNVLLADRHPGTVRYQLMVVERGLRAMPALNPSEHRLEAHVADKLVEVGSWDAAGLCADTEHLEATLSALSDWLRLLGSRLERRYAPRRPARSVQLVQTA
nr:circularly permuted type 2 ATP-grasp protein [Oceanococcus sp. HetDA_MAG_MS8]